VQLRVRRTSSSEVHLLAGTEGSGFIRATPPEKSHKTKERETSCCVEPEEQSCVFLQAANVTLMAAPGWGRLLYTQNNRKKIITRRGGAKLNGTEKLEESPREGQTRRGPKKEYITKKGELLLF